MTGIRRKISLGFLFLALMLMFSGLVSLFELRRLGHSTRELLENSSYNMELSKRMLDALQDQNTSLLETIVLERPSFEASYTEARQKFDTALAEASADGEDRYELSAIYEARTKYYALVGDYFDLDMNTDIEWFVQMYKTTYLELTTAIKTYMVESQGALLNQASSMRSNAYRAMMPGVITLCVAILMILIFAYLIDLYYTRPLMGIEKGMRNHISHRVPFRVEMQGRDEIYSIKTNIENLINSRKDCK